MKKTHTHKKKTTNSSRQVRSTIPSRAKCRNCDTVTRLTSTFVCADGWNPGKYWIINGYQSISMDINGWNRFCPRTPWKLGVIRDLIGMLKRFWNCIMIFRNFGTYGNFHFSGCPAIHQNLLLIVKKVSLGVKWTWKKQTTWKILNAFWSDHHHSFKHPQATEPQPHFPHTALVAIAHGDILASVLGAEIPIWW